MTKSVRLPLSSNPTNRSNYQHAWNFRLSREKRVGDLSLLRRVLLRLIASIAIVSLFSGAAWSNPGTYYPLNGGSLSGATQTFSLYPDEFLISDWWIYAGSSPGAKDYADSGNLGSGLIHEVSGFPEDGSLVYVRLWYRMSGGLNWFYRDLTFTAQIPSTPNLVRPVPTLDSRMTGRAVSYWIDDNGYGATSYILSIGYFPGAEYYAGSLDNIYYSGEVTALSMNVDGLPIASPGVSEDMYVALMAKRPGEGYRRVDDAIIQPYDRTIVPSITLPAPDGTLTGDTMQFWWTGNSVDVSNYWLWVGAKLGGFEYYDSGNLNTNFSHTVDSLPTDSSEVYVRLWYLSGGVWKYTDEQYKASGIGPEIIDPTPGSAPSGSPVEYSWTDNGIGVYQWWLYSGYSPGGKNYFNSGNLLGATSALVDNTAPDTGEDYTVRLWFKMSPGGIWKHSDFTYTTID